MAVSPPSRFAYVTLLTNNTYLAGVLVLWFSLRKAGSKYPLVVMATPAVSKASRSVLSTAGISLVDVDRLHPPFDHMLASSDFRFADTWTKLRAFGLLDYERIVVLDSDMLVLRNLDELFHLKLGRDQIAAVHVCACNPLRLSHYPPDWVPENCAHTTIRNPEQPPPKIHSTSPRPYHQLNSGTLVLRPSRELSEPVLRALETEKSAPDFLFPDQDLLAIAFRGKWVPLPWYYNAMRTMPDAHNAMWDVDKARCIHYILSDKPWTSRRANHPPFQMLQDWWWAVFDEVHEVLKDLDPDISVYISSLVGT